MQINFNPSPKIDSARDPASSQQREDDSFSTLLDQAKSSSSAAGERSSAKTEGAQRSSRARESDDAEQDKADQDKAPGDFRAAIAGAGAVGAAVERADAGQGRGDGELRAAADAAQGEGADARQTAQLLGDEKRLQPLTVEGSGRSREHAVTAQKAPLAQAVEQQALALQGGAQRQGLQGDIKALVEQSSGPAAQPSDAPRIGDVLASSGAALVASGVRSHGPSGEGALRSDAALAGDARGEPFAASLRDGATPAMPRKAAGEALAPRSNADLSLEESLARARPAKAVGAAVGDAAGAGAAGLSLSQAGQGSAASAAAPQQMSLDTAVGERQWGSMLANRLTSLGTTPGVRSVELNLSPRELGPLSVSLRIDANAQAQLSLEAAHPHTRKALDESLDQLRSAFSERGITLAQVQLVDRPAATAASQQQSAQPQFNQGGGGEFAGQQQAFQQRGEQRPDALIASPENGSLALDEAGADQALASPSRPQRRDGGIDLFA